MKLRLVTHYHTTVFTDFELPEGKDHNDIKEWWVKWGNVVVTFNDGTEITFEETVPVLPDTKRPDLTEIRDLANNIMREEP